MQEDQEFRSSLVTLQPGLCETFLSNKKVTWSTLQLPSRVPLQQAQQGLPGPCLNAPRPGIRYMRLSQACENFGLSVHYHLT